MKTQLNKETALIQNTGIRTLVQNCLASCPTCFWSMPAATTGKYHPAISLGTGGLIRHTKAVVRIAQHLMHMQDIAPGTLWHDNILAACILHDCCKKSDNETYTAFDHPTRAAQLITAEATLLACSDDSLISPSTVRTIAACVEAHMGRWNTDPRHPNITLPTPITPLQQIVHTADYLASRKDITLADIS